MAALNKILIYARDMQKTAQFYEKFFGFKSQIDEDGKIIELTSSDQGADILIHQASKGAKLGQASVKLVFDVDDIEKFKQNSAKLGLEFGATHIANGYSFANAKDPDKNSVSISSRAFRKNAGERPD